MEQSISENISWSKVTAEALAMQCDKWPLTLLYGSPTQPFHYVSLERIHTCEHIELGGVQGDVT